MPDKYRESGIKQKAPESHADSMAQDTGQTLVESTGQSPAEKSSIAYQNKDIISKIFGENLKEKSFAAYGLKVPKITAVLPTNLPAVEANELRMDEFFQFEDDSLGIADYESTYDYKDKVKYLGYVVRVLKHNSLVGKIQRKLRVIIIYTGDIRPQQTNPELHIGCLDFKVEEVFLSNLDAPAIETMLTAKINRGEALTEEEQMQLIILPLAYQGLEPKQECVRRLFELFKKLPDDKTRTFLLSGMLVFADKIISQEESEFMKGWINMTKIGKLYAEEAMEKVREARAEEQMKHEAEVQELKAKNDSIINNHIINMFHKGYTEKAIHEVMPDISLTRIRALKV